MIPAGERDPKERCPENGIRKKPCLTMMIEDHFFNLPLDVNMEVNEDDEEDSETATSSKKLRRASAIVEAARRHMVNMGREKLCLGHSGGGTQTHGEHG